MTKRNLVIVGNWKMNKTPTETKQFFTEFTKLYEKEASKIDPTTWFGLAVPAINLVIAAENKVAKKMLVAAQDVHQEASGAFTGDLSASMLKAVGANSVVIGHSERRAYHHEDDALINLKTQKALKEHLIPIVCIGESLKEREQNIWKDVLQKQIKGAFTNINNTEILKVIIAYEPIWAIGTGKTASADQAQEACQYVRLEIEKLFNKQVANQIIIQYGGSVKPENVAEILNKPDIDGALVGGASLEANSFIKLLTLNK